MTIKMPISNNEKNSYKKNENTKYLNRK